MCSLVSFFGCKLGMQQLFSVGLFVCVVAVGFGLEQLFFGPVCLCCISGLWHAAAFFCSLVLSLAVLFSFIGPDPGCYMLIGFFVWIPVISPSLII